MSYPFVQMSRQQWRKVYQAKRVMRRAARWYRRDKDVGHLIYAVAIRDGISAWRSL